MIVRPNKSPRYVTHEADTVPYGAHCPWREYAGRVAHGWTTAFFEVDAPPWRRRAAEKAGPELPELTAHRWHEKDRELAETGLGTVARRLRR